MLSAATQHRVEVSMSSQYRVSHVNEIGQRKGGEWPAHRTAGNQGSRREGQSQRTHADQLEAAPIAASMTMGQSDRRQRKTNSQGGQIDQAATLFVLKQPNPREYGHGCSRAGTAPGPRAIPSQRSLDRDEAGEACERQDEERQRERPASQAAEQKPTCQDQPSSMVLRKRGVAHDFG